MSAAHAAIADLFSVFHDGVIVAAEMRGEDLVLDVEIRYLAERVDPAMIGFRVTLAEVRDLRYLPWPNPGEAPPPVCHEALAVLRAVDVLEGDTRDGEVVVSVVRRGRIDADAGGEMVFRSTGVTVNDAADRPHSVDSLRALARGYWDAWSAENAAKKAAP